MIEQFREHRPVIHPEAFVHPSAVIVGQVFVDAGASIWPCVVLRGDMGRIHIGKNTSIQDGTIAHMTQDFSETIIGDNVTVGHGVILHGCIVENGCLIGMGSTILDQTKIGRDSFVAAGSLVTGSKNFEPESFICGSPAKRLREISDKERLICSSSPIRYYELSRHYKRD